MLYIDSEILARLFFKSHDCFFPLYVTMPAVSTSSPCWILLFALVAAAMLGTALAKTPAGSSSSSSSRTLATMVNQTNGIGSRTFFSDQKKMQFGLLRLATSHQVALSPTYPCSTAGRLLRKTPVRLIRHHRTVHLCDSTATAVSVLSLVGTAQRGRAIHMTCSLYKSTPRPRAARPLATK